MAVAIPPKTTSGPDALSFVSATRRTNGASQTGRSFTDFAINGHPLHPIIANDNISVFGWGTRAIERTYAKALIPTERSDSRAALYICGECGDLGCGYFSVKVTLVDDCVVWSEPGWEDNLFREQTVTPFEGKWRDLWFDRVQYRTALGYYL